MRRDQASTGTPCSGSSTLLVAAPTRLPEPAATRTTATRGAGGCGHGASLPDGPGSRAQRFHGRNNGHTQPTTSRPYVRSLREGDCGCAEQGTTGRARRERAGRHGGRLDADLRGRQAAPRTEASPRWCGGTRSRCSRPPTGDVYAIGNHDPFSRVSTLGRGIVGTRGDVPFVASTTARQAFDLRTGRCLDDASVSVPSYAVRVVDGVVHVGPRAGP